MKIVIDTNVILSALFSNQGTSHQLLRWLLSEYDNNGKKYNVVSNTLAIEYQDVLSRKVHLERIGIAKEDLIRFIDDICLLSHHQTINFIWRPFLKDVADDMLLEVAFNASANFIITYNIKDFKNVEKYFGIKVLKPKELLHIIGVLV